MKMCNMNTGDGISASQSEWSFDGDVPKSFTSHVSKSVPLYGMGQDLVVDVSDFFVAPNSTIYEIGCSVGRLTAMLADRHKEKNVTVVGVDCSAQMIRQAEIENARENIRYVVGDVMDFDFEKTDFIISYYTAQFISPRNRQKFFDKIYCDLNWGGALALFEKVRAPDARFQDYMVQLYVEYKLKQGYTEENILAKSRSLKRVLEPFSSAANVDLLGRAGFKDVMTILKYVCFEGFLAIK